MNKTLAERAAQELLIYIREEGLVEGEKLPNEYELSEKLGVGRNTVREAVRVLASRNILRIKQGAGTFLTDKPGMVEDPLGFSFMEDQRKLVTDLMQVRLIVEPAIAALAAQNATEKDIQQLTLLCEEVERMIEEGKDFSEKDRAFHAKLADCTKNLVMKNLIPVICQGVEAFSSNVSEQEYRQTVETHRNILMAVKNGKAVDAEQAMSYHLLYNIQRYKKE
ncbi:FadR/GntR family transcriptional regulator [Alkalibacter saccharofermentans]|uniref:DNA-binding transcriptional regulator, FadR family n=1 Tax=Alkalibacter saccharofermentans DSM 14828 TaxID=1120975 RepID=A0A1M4TR07_9FIRM|nr:FCD domain-containing protein [Alkalibacter saccharofermentans]SHE46825.1 DNA-binding transcriptional regulator, FadR family [Alkalibacter saccharofermentans DSM 14828]